MSAKNSDATLTFPRSRVSLMRSVFEARVRSFEAAIREGETSPQVMEQWADNAAFLRALIADLSKWP